MSDPLYQTQAWKETRLAVLGRDNYICQCCLEDGILTPATTVHHVKYLDKYPELGLEIDNLISVCGDCHAKIHRGRRKTKHKRAKRRARVIKG